MGIGFKGNNLICSHLLMIQWPSLLEYKETILTFERRGHHENETLGETLTNIYRPLLDLINLNLILDTALVTLDIYSKFFQL